jgi:hypothetical protein
MANERVPPQAGWELFTNGDAANRRFPMISHLGTFLLLYGGNMSINGRNGEDVLGLALSCMEEAAPEDFMNP